MKCIGLVGGIGWESTATYYRVINQEVRNRFGSLRSARVLLNSLEFQSLDSLVKGERWDEAGGMMGEAAATLQKAGADAIVVCACLMHYVAPAIEAAVSIPLLHIGDAILEELHTKGLADIGLLGTRFTIEHDFILDRPVRSRRWSKARVHRPTPADCDRLDAIIYGEFCRGLYREGARQELLRMAGDLHRQGAKAIVLASTELALALHPEDLSGRIFDSAELHALKAVRWAMDEIKKPDYSRGALTEVPGAPVIKGSKGRKVTPARRPQMA